MEMSMVYEAGFVAETDPLSEDRQLIELLDNGNVEAVSQRLAEITRREREQSVREILTAGNEFGE
jgi:chromosome segregation and condensation protein ScpB